MKRVAIVLCVASILPAHGTAGFGLPWFHTRPKPVFLDPPVAPRHRGDSHGAAAHPGPSQRDLREAHDPVRSEPVVKTDPETPAKSPHAERRK